MKEKDLDNLLDNLLEGLNKIIDDSGKREDFEKFKKENEGKSIEDLLDELKESMVKRLKPNFKIVIESNPDGNGGHLQLEGTRPSLKLGLAELVTRLVRENVLTEEMIRSSIETGIKTAHKED